MKSRCSTLAKPARAKGRGPEGPCPDAVLQGMGLFGYQ